MQTKERTTTNFRMHPSLPSFFIPPSKNFIHASLNHCCGSCVCGELHVHKFQQHFLLLCLHIFLGGALTITQLLSLYIYIVHVQYFLTLCICNVHGHIIQSVLSIQFIVIFVFFGFPFKSIRICTFNYLRHNQVCN